MPKLSLRHFLYSRTRLAMFLHLSSRVSEAAALVLGAVARVAQAVFVTEQVRFRLLGEHSDRLTL